MGRVVLVVARLAENLQWAAGWRGDVVVVQKGVDLPNVGREASSWLWFLETAEIDPGATYAFLQGDPAARGVTVAHLRAVDAFTPLGLEVLTCDQDGAPNHVGLPLAKRAREWFGSGLPQAITFCAGAQFLLPGWLALTRSREWYAGLRRAVEADDLGPWVMERLWWLVWSGADTAPPTRWPAPPPEGPVPVRALLGQGGAFDGLTDASPPDLSGWVQPNLGAVASRLLAGAPREVVVAAARANIKRCFCPPDKLIPFSPMAVERPSGKRATSAARSAFSREDMRVS